jgi:hypothetical protein
MAYGIEFAVGRTEKAGLVTLARSLFVFCKSSQMLQTGNLIPK